MEEVVIMWEEEQEEEAGPQLGLVQVTSVSAITR